MKRLVVLAVILITVIPFIERPARSQDRPAQATGGGRHALLVGIEKYPTETAGWSRLTGPKADVAALRAALIDRAGFDAKNVYTLIDEKATHKNIIAWFRKLVDDADKGDLILFYYSGHGSQLSDDDGDEKSDGLDESLVPFDAVLPDGTRNDIRDDDIEDLIEYANKKTSNVVLIFDSCNSGTVTRSGGPTLRSVPGEKVTTRGFAGKSKSKNLLEDSSVNRTITAAKPRFTDGMHFPKNLSYVSLGACRSNEQAAEIQLPGSEPGSKQVRGIFTYALVQQLYDMKPGWSYQDLMDEVRAKVHTHRRAQTPITTGQLANRSLFLGGAVATRPNFVLVGTGNDFTLQAGLAHGVVAGSIYNVQPSNASEDKEETRLGSIRIQRPTATTSKIQWLEMADGVIKQKRHRYRVFEVARGAGDTRMKVAIFPQGIPPKVVEELKNRVKKSADLVQSTPDRAQLWVRLVDRAGESVLEAAQPDGKSLPIRTTLDRGLSLFMKKVNALGAKNRILEIRKETSETLCVQAQIERLTKDKKPLGPPERDPETGVPVLPVGQRFTCRIENCSEVPVYASLLVISPDGAVTVAWQTNDDEAIKPGREVQTPVFKTEIPRGAEAFYETGTDVFRFCVTTEPHDFTTFEQEPVTKMRTTRGFEIEREGMLSGKEPLEDSWLTVSMEIRTKKVQP